MCVIWVWLELMLVCLYVLGLMIWWSSGLCESYTGILHIEMSVIGFDEAVSDNEGLSKLGWQVQSHNTHNTSWFACLVNLQNVVPWANDESVSAELELEVG